MTNPAAPNEAAPPHATKRRGPPKPLLAVLAIGAIGGKKVGVSVARAYKPANMSYPDTEVQALLQRKLDGIVASSANVSAADRWVKQILHVFTANRAATEAVQRVYPSLPAVTRADTIVLVTQTTGGGFVYCNPDPPLGSECP